MRSTMIMEKNSMKLGVVLFLLMTGLSACDNQRGTTNDQSRGHLEGPAGRDTNTSQVPSNTGPLSGSAAMATATPIP